MQYQVPVDHYNLYGFAVVNTVGKASLVSLAYTKANVAYCIPMRSLAAVAVLFSRQFSQVYGINSDSADKKAGQLKEFSPLGRSVCKLWRGLAARLASGRDQNSSHTLLEPPKQERALSRPIVS